MPAHPVIQKLTTVLDLKHSCGYITMLNSTIDTRPYRGTAKVPSPNSSEELSRNASPSPVMGSDISFDECIDDEEQEDTTIDCRSSDDMVIVNDTVKPGVISSSQDDWVPLDLCYGVSLFDSDLCEWTCQKVRIINII